ncbi:hypothetical protein Bca4012_067316 [Brassica carinata]|uniref:Uncharacterized protein n=1 Tax=Brassica carinata TaxID=52824 RepID=A0A8X8AYQ3_BRACI|nr:hypothetical protein Bca52824_019572 [Brassica carinata]
MEETERNDGSSRNDTETIPYRSNHGSTAPPPPPPQTYTFSPAAAAHNFYGNCYQYHAPPPPYFHYQLKKVMVNVTVTLSSMVLLTCGSSLTPLLQVVSFDVFVLVYG